jgi:hypothetical protein
MRWLSRPGLVINLRQLERRSVKSASSASPLARLSHPRGAAMCHGLAPTRVAGKGGQVVVGKRSRWVGSLRAQLR